jgi:hypothetical protein
MHNAAARRHDYCARRFFASLSLFFLVVVPVTLHAVQGGKTEVFPVQKSAPAVVFVEKTGSEADLRRELRMKTGVTELGELNVRFSQAPTGKYGFVAGTSLAMALVTQSPDLVLERARLGANFYEVHKLADGNAMLVGFVPSEILADLKQPERPKAIGLSFGSIPSDTAPYIVALPLVKLSSDRMPSPIDPKKSDGGVILHMDLRGTTNRQPLHGVP